MKKLALVACLLPMLVAAGSVVAQQPQRSAPHTAAQDKAQRYALVHKIVSQWGPYVQAVHGENVDAWADRLVPTFRKASLAQLQQAGSAGTFEAMTSALIGQRAANQQRLPGGKAPKTLGSSAGDLVYTSLASCVIVDTRVVGGPFAATNVRHFKASGPNFTGQGGSSTNCGIPDTPASLVLSVTSLSATGNGYFRLWPYSTTQPTASNISYRTGQNIQNDIILKMSQGLTQDFSVYSSSGSHLVVNVLGYFAASQATTPECTYAYEDVSVAGGASTSVFATCAAGYAATGGGCDINNAGLINIYNEPGYSDPRTWFCQFNNTTGGTLSGTAQARCCRVPGRS